MPWFSRKTHEPLAEELISPAPPEPSAPPRSPTVEPFSPWAEQLYARRILDDREGFRAGE
jgi:hypothetical protein